MVDSIDQLDTSSWPEIKSFRNGGYVRSARIYRAPGKGNFYY